MSKSATNDSEIKIADFGFAKRVPLESSLRTQCGTPGYVAPEILEGVPYGTKVDMWSLGVIVYILLGGYPPFVDNNQAELFKKIRRGKYEFHDKYWGRVSQKAKDLISALLTIDPRHRLRAADALKNDWICESDEVLEVKDLGNSLQELKKFNAKRQFKAGVHAVRIPCHNISFTDTSCFNVYFSYTPNLFTVVVTIAHFCQEDELTWKRSRNLGYR